jgi:ABC-type molybdenum transport system ATPase subunit/photorepair protein PhrA
MRFLGRQFSAIAKKPANGVPLITFERAAVYPLGETITPFFKDFTWRINESETWAVVGPSSSSRRVLLEVTNHFKKATLTVNQILQGQHRCSPPSSAKFPLIQRMEAALGGSQSLWPSNIVHYLRFNDAITTAQFYSERYEAYREADDLTLRNWLVSRMGDVDEAKLRRTSEVLGVDKLLDGSLMNLSNGQQRRARIVKALLQDPEILLLDEPYSTDPHLPH